MRQAGPDSEDERDTSPGPPSGPISRRRFLLRTGLGSGLALAAAGCGGDDGGAPSTGAGDRPAAPPSQAVSNDVALARLAAGLEMLAIDTYAAALTAAAAGSLGEVPPAVAAFVTTARDQHQVHLRSWNEVLRGAGEPPVTLAHAGLEPMVERMFAEVDDGPGLAELALTLETIASHTYNKAIPTLGDAVTIGLAARIQVVDQQHVAVLRYLLGAYPVGTADLEGTTVAFQPTDRSASG